MSPSFASNSSGDKKPSRSTSQDRKKPTSEPPPEALMMVSPTPFATSCQLIPFASTSFLPVSPDLLIRATASKMSSTFGWFFKLQTRPSYTAAACQTGIWIFHACKNPWNSSKDTEPLKSPSAEARRSWAAMSEMTMRSCPMALKTSVCVALLLDDSCSTIWKRCKNSTYCTIAGSSHWRAKSCQTGGTSGRIFAMQACHTAMGMMEWC
mmetsp:Transcript_162875/g.522222  ORF Transcript_162875/g.522222 Transcript_162875/m.522222 type:complete len:209 (-) Transcript_162875:2098-2724(-)